MGRGLPTEKEWRLEHLPQALAPWRGRRLALYGTGANAREALLRHGDLLADALVVDDAHVGEELCGRRVMGLAEALDSGVEVLVLAARMASLEAVYERVSGTCRERGVTVASLYGCDETQLHDELAEQGDRTWAELWELVDGCDVLSVPFYEMHQHLSRFPEASPAGVPRSTDEAVLGMVARALRTGRRVALLMGPAWDHSRWIAGEVGQEALSRLEVLNSDELGMVRENGLFRALLERHPGERVLHVGDLPVDDFLAPRRYGIQACLLPRGHSDLLPRERLEWAEVLALAASAQDRALVDLVGSRLSDEARSGRPSFDELAWGAMGPLVAGFLSWLRDGLRREPADAVLFASRDGYVAKLLYDWWRANGAEDLPPARYLYVSRKAATLPYVDDPETQDYLLWYGSNLRPRDLMHALFGLPEDAIEEPSDDATSPWRWVEANAGAIARTAREARTGALAYLASLNVRPGGSFRYVDYAGLGTSQHLLEQLSGVPMHGAYFLRRPGPRPQGTRIESYLSASDANMASGFLSTEAIMSSPEPTLAGYDADGTPVLATETRPAEDLAALRRAHEQVLAFGREWLPAHGDEVVSPEVLDALLGFFGTDAIRLQRENSWKGVAMDARGMEETVPLERGGGAA